MSKRAFIIHGWDDSPNNGWFPWLKKKLEAAAVEVHVPAMPDPERPDIDTWALFLKHAVGQADGQTFFVGHSIGGQTILRYLATLPANVKVGGAVLVAGWVTLKPAATEDEDSVAVATPWLERPLNWPKIRTHCDQFTAIVSDDDQFVPIEDSQVFLLELGAKIITEHHKRHLGGLDGVVVLPSVLQAVAQMMNG